MIPEPPALIADLLAATPGWQAQAETASLDDTDARAILDEAARLARDLLDPLATQADARGCRVEDGRVKTPPGYSEALATLGEMGWIAPDLPEGLGGMGLPLALQAGVGMQLDGAALPFMMAPGASRAGAHCLARQAPDLARDWAPRLAAGEWTATICISEPEAGSDVGRIRTRAVEHDDGWRISGTKCWISFGDHDMAPRIGHLALARTGAAEDGTRGLSLFLVPNTTDDGAPNGVHVERIEEKLGLHGSPTCVLRFEDAKGTLIGAPGRGLAQLFAMIEHMRLLTGWQGAGVALKLAELARGYAAERRQGGRPDAPPVPIDSHPDVRRQLATLEARASILAALVLEVAVTLQAAHEGDADAQDRAAFLLPLVKTFGAEGAFQSASDAIQVFGGAGYTREWSVARHLRDTRILAIYEGTTGMQAQDFLLRRLIRDKGRGLAAFATAARTDLGRCPESAARKTAESLVSEFETLSADMTAADTDTQLLAADGYLRAGWETVSACLAARLVSLGGPLAASGRFHLAAAPERFALARAGTRIDPATLA